VTDLVAPSGPGGRWSSRSPGLTAPPSVRDWGAGAVQVERWRNAEPFGHHLIAMVGECYFATCRNPAMVEASGTYDSAFGLQETVALAVCERHAEALGDEVVLLQTA
jgi:hypothetical protein